MEIFKPNNGDDSSIFSNNSYPVHFEYLTKSRNAYIEKYVVTIEENSKSDKVELEKFVTEINKWPISDNANILEGNKLDEFLNELILDFFGSIIDG